MMQAKLIEAVGGPKDGELFNWYGNHWERVAVHLPECPCKIVTPEEIDAIRVRVGYYAPARFGDPDEPDVDDEWVYEWQGER